MKSILRSARKLASIAGIVALLVVTLLVPAANAAPPSYYTKADETPVFSVAGDTTTKVGVIKPVGTEVAVTDFIYDAGAPVWAKISSTDPKLNGGYVAFALLTSNKPAKAVIKSEFDALKAQVDDGIAARGTNGVTPNDLKWLRANITNAELFPVLTYTAGTYQTSADAELYRAKSTALKFLDKDRIPVTIPANTVLDVEITSAADGFVLVMAPAQYAGAFIEASKLQETETPSERKTRLDAAFDSAINELTWEELVYVLKTEMGIPDVVIGGCNGKCGGGTSRP